jgi:hypothetical protein
MSEQFDTAAYIAAVERRKAALWNHFDRQGEYVEPDWLEAYRTADAETQANLFRAWLEEG